MTQEKIGNECDNLKKKIAREITLTGIKINFKDKPITMLDLLGDGTGAKYYAENHPISDMYLIERNKKRFNLVTDSHGYNYLPIQYSSETTFHAYRIKLQKYLESSKAPNVDVFNLDLCSFFHIDETKDSPVSLLKTIFEKRIINNNGLLFFTFQLKGKGVYYYRKKKVVLQDMNSVIDYINQIAISYGIKLEILPLKSTYNSKEGQSDKRGNSVMMNAGVKVKYKDDNITNEI